MIIRMSDKRHVIIQHLLPKRAITEFGWYVANAKAGLITSAIIRWFVGKYGVNMDEAVNPDISSYASFNTFFTRPLRAGVRPLANSTFISPVDGAISQLGHIEHDQLLQAKGHTYSTRALVGGDAALAEKFNNGEFATIYLSPKDYHRIHIPCDGKLTQMIYVPGDLYSVNPTTARGVPGLFARNERVVCVFETAHGLMVITLVGAAIVGSMETVWHGTVNPPRTRNVRTWDYTHDNITLKQGDEMGRFLLGSTVVMLFQQGAMQFNPDWQADRPVQMGTAMSQN